MENLTVWHWLLVVGLACYVLWPPIFSLFKGPRKKPETDREVLDRLAPRAAARPIASAGHGPSRTPPSDRKGVATRTQQQAPQDLSWPALAANWFLIGIGALIQDSIDAEGFAGGADQFAGRLVALAIGAAVPVAVLYLFLGSKKSFRFRRALTISAWCILGVMFYPIVRGP